MSLYLQPVQSFKTGPRVTAEHLPITCLLSMNYTCVLTPAVSAKSTATKDSLSSDSYSIVPALSLFCTLMQFRACVGFTSQGTINFHYQHWRPDVSSLRIIPSPTTVTIFNKSMGGHNEKYTRKFPGEVNHDHLQGTHYTNPGCPTTDISAYVLGVCVCVCVTCSLVLYLSLSSLLKHYRVTNIQYVRADYLQLAHEIT
jgi:hypothetical protein